MRFLQLQTVDNIMKHKNNYTAGTFLYSNRTLVERVKLDAPNIYT